MTSEVGRIGTPVQRLWRKVEVQKDGCWNWMGYVNSWGYGTIHVDGEDRFVHRFVYETFVGPIPEGQQIDHLCRNRRCCNPSHLEAVTRTENILRGEGVAALNSRKQFCDKGHPFTDANTYLMPGSGRACKTCRREASRRFRQIRKAMA